MSTATHRLVYSAHQPDLLPYSGFWHKLAKADVFDLKIWDQYVHKGYQRRVQMRGSWVTLPLADDERTDPIVRQHLKPHAAALLADQISSRYLRANGKARNWERHGPRICDEVLSIKTDLLWEFNFRLILLVRDILGIETPLTFSRPARPGLRGSAGLISVMQAFPGDLTYLSGIGARSYMGDCQEFDDADIPVLWSRHEPVTGDSILTVLMDHEDPMSAVLHETQPEEAHA